MRSVGTVRRVHDSVEKKAADRVYKRTQGHTHKQIETTADLRTLPLCTVGTVGRP